jgi:hypothetical protein
MDRDQEGRPVLTTVSQRRQPAPQQGDESKSETEAQVDELWSAVLDLMWLELVTP